jgi:hypothetical protein
LLGFLLLLAWVAGARPAQAQLGADWLRQALSPPRPGLKQGPSNAIYPPQVISLRFSHRQHVEAEVSCASCHDAIDKSTRPTDRNLPAHAQCESCHDIEAARRGEATDPLSTCAACHTGHVPGTESVAANDFPPANVHFSHQSHLVRGARCTDCHASAGAATLATRADLPRMVTCLGCHDGRQAPNRCTTCHLSEPDGVLKTRFAAGTLAPVGTLRDDDHGRDFLRRHAHVARSEMESCSSCHRAAECEGCHAASSKAFRVHPPDWTQSHGISSRGREMDCQSCHREQSFCISCHQQLGVASESRLRQPGTALAGQRFHPPGFTGLSRASPDHHAWAAQANIQSCAACHQEQTCLKCHASTASVPGSPAFNPHPPGFGQGGAACRALRASPVACAKCHGGGAGLVSLGQLLVGCP